MSASQSGVYNTQQFTDMGTPLVGGRLFTYAFGTTTHKTTYTDHAGAIPHTYTADGLGGQFIALDARGELPAPLYLVGGSYDLALKTAAGATVWTRRADPVWDITNDLSASSGASLVGYIPAGVGAVATTVQAELRRISYASQFPSLAAAASSGVDGLVFSPGAYTISADTTFTMPVHVMPGALITVTAGKVATFSAGIEAGNHTIFSTSDNFIANPTAVTSVVIRGCNVKADWFCAKVSDLANILSISDQTNNLTKAYRAAVGNYSVVNGANWNTQYADGVLELGHGYYRVDGTFAWGTLITGVYYKVTGFKMIGAGVNSSFLIRTDMSSTAYVMFGAFYTGEMTVCDGFKITAYNPTGPSYASAAKAMVFFQGDSLFIGEIWVSGGETYTTDTNGIKRNGVGIQFCSCVDTFFDRIITEYCVTSIAFYSSVVSGTNIDCYRSLGQAIGMGNFVADWPDTQATSSRVNLANVQAIGGVGNGISVIEKGDTGILHIGNSEFDGYNSEFGTYGGNYFCYMLTGTSLNGSVVNTAIRNYRVSTFMLNGTASLGRATGAFSIRDVYVSGQTQVGTYGFINCATTSYLNLLTDGVSIDDFAGCLLIAPVTGNARLLNTNLSAYVGQSDGSANRQLFVSYGSNITMVGATRNLADTVPLNQFGYSASGNVYVDIDNLYNATRTISGSATVKMPSKIAYA